MTVHLMRLPRPVPIQRIAIQCALVIAQIRRIVNTIPVLLIPGKPCVLVQGFNARKLARIPGLKRGDVIAIVVAVGRRRTDVLIEPR